ncbi:CAP-Gly domain-containing linker protein 4-like [Patiria miniata]|uniref:CAP-Gly domain-containing protein n=1 Tax=Patiria miniata TaxID=46514 RepID=A0A913ZA21_PATMI|nr:CAP-Gly domain-containing linker protein 4-like [Patiria miniata]
MKMDEDDKSFEYLEHKNPVSSPSPPIIGSTSGRTHPIIHPIRDAPLCTQCKDLRLTFFDPHCPGCWSLAQDPRTTVGELFAVLRQWVPQVQRSVLAIGQEILQRDFHIDDRDGLTDMTLLHYASKAGCEGVGERSDAVELVSLLLERGASPELRSRWTDMTVLHYAVFFDVVPLIRLLLKATQFKDLESSCREFENGTPLHIAACNGCLESARCLLQLGANCRARDAQGRMPLHCVPDASDVARSGWEVTAGKLRQLLHPDSQFTRPRYSPQNYDDVPSRVLLTSLGLGLGDRVYVGDSKAGTLRFYGTTQFAPGVWAGIELDEAIGKHDGTVEDVAYFKCPPNHGIFAPLSKVSKFVTSPRPSTPRSVGGGAIAVSHGKIDVSHVSPKVDTGLRSRTLSVASIKQEDISVGDRVTIAGQVPRHGIVRYSGLTQFAQGWWYGIELDRPEGKNDGSVGSVRYFTCSPQHGLFAHSSKLTRCNDYSQNSLDSSTSSQAAQTNAADRS